ncbi:hypothetical protein KP509_30G016400 [Ceratopteris richardii]|nr:hypothetical protein KP509_30G016400 [Ceratopteris richardii]
MALEDCSDLLGSVMDYLNSSVVALNNLDVRSLQNSLKEIEILLSTASSEQTACTDGFYNITGNSRNSMLLKQENVDKVLINAICLVETLSTLGPNLSSWKNVVPQVHLRRLLSTDDDDDDTMVGHLVTRMERRLQEFNSSSNPDAVVAQDGTGRYATIKEALDAVPEDRSGRYVIYIKAGIYNEGPLNISKDLKDITLIGDGCNKTIITGNANVALLNYTTYRSATLGVQGDGFQARYITFRNTAGPYGHQAVALRINAKTAVLEGCCFEGYQDTLYPLSGEQFYKNCKILGTVDFIFGNALAVFQNCELGARLPTLGQSNTYTAQARKDDAQLTGFAFQNCSLTQGDDLKSAPYAVSTYLGRPWKTYSTVVFLQSYMGPHIHPDGWMSWNLSRPFESTCFYGEYANTGPGSNIASRVNWKGVHPSLSESEASQYTVSAFFPDTAFIPTDVTYKESL